MLENVLEKTGDRVAETARRASRASAALEEAFEEGVATAKRAMKHCADATEEFMQDNQQRIKRHPLESLVAAFAAGTALGIAIGWFSRKK